MKRKLMMFLALFFIGIGIVTAQTQVQGTVVDETGEPVIGATIQIKGTSQGTVSDIDGNFNLSAPAGGTLVISYVGYQTQEVPVSTNVRVILGEDSEILEDVVVIGYMQRRITSTSASVVKVNSEQIEEKPTANPMDALQGKVAGLQVYTSSGEPSQFSSLKLHGVGSLGAGSAPLYILDGMPVTTATIMSANPNDFESIQILKDAAATSIYGARAANGVVYITTKNGKVAERAQITARGQYGVSNLANPDYYKQMMNTDELLRLWGELGIRTEAQIQAIRDTYGDNDTQWWKYYLRPNIPTYQGDVSISGGGGRTNYYISGGIFNQEGMREGSNYKKLNLRSNINSQLNEIMRVGLNTSVAYDLSNISPYERNNTTGGGLAFLAPPYYTYIDPETGKEYEELIPGWNRLTPKYDTKHTPSTEKTIHYNLAGNISINPMEGLTFRSQAGLELRDFFYDRNRLASHRSAPGNGFGTKDFSRRATMTFTNTAQYNFSIADQHNFATLVGHEYINYDYHYIRANASGMGDDRLMLLPSGTNRTVDESIAEYAFLSYFTQISYDYDEKYFIDLVGRNDASSRFGKNKRNALFGSVGLLWKAKKENLLEDVDWIDQLDLKFSIGTQGNAEIGNYNAYALAGGIGQYNGSTGWGLTSPGNDDLGWERQRKTSFGVKASLFDFLSLDIEYYHRLTSDMLMDVPLPLTSGVPQDGLGFASVTQNVGKYLNQGVDIHLQFDIIKRKDLNLDGYMNFNYNADKVVELFQDRNSWILPGYGFGYIVGEPVNFVYPIFKQINPQNGYPEWYVPGDDIAVTRKDEVTSVFSDALEQNTGIRRNTPMVGGFGLSGDFKGFYMNVDFTFALGKNMISNDRFFFENPFQFAGFNQSKNTLNYWKQPGDKAEFPGLDYLENVSPLFTEFDSRMIEDASFMRLKNLTLGYNIPKNFLRSQNIFTGAKLYVTGRNVLTFTKYTGPDPEVDSNLSLGAYPNSRQFIVGFELNF
ncbi:SusC/RagA family TonB-linked outer membrane protein [Proteiniphilum saccharofermentans]|uniref:SusC/RagA family TonB-linked outer membrane protein n=1 Tax=Proteiniphilum saccharofermentans TaxID=1642647 RepID=UPI0028AB9A5E|nr:SusC/RagA family TonB-linked outer membrane protein [Proteiniphilum saccharofermentans]